MSVAGGTAPYYYLWSNGNINANQTIYPVTTTSYQVAVHDAHGCTAAQQNMTVFVNPPLEVVANGTQQICAGNTSTISAVANGGNGGPYSYSWNQGMIQGNLITVSPAHDSTFIVVVTDGCGTPAAMDSVALTVNPLPVVSFLPHVIRGCTPVQASFVDFSTTAPGSTYVWDLGDQTITGNQNSSHLYTAPGNYTVSLFVLTPQGCHDNLTIPNAVIVYGFPKADFDQSTDVVSLLNSNVNFYDKSIDAVNWEWNFGDASGLASERNPAHEYADTGSYIIRLVVNSSGGCPDTSFGLLRVEDQFTIYIPNAFTPNGDGINEGFIAMGVGYTDYDMWIIDRWGKQIFHSTSKTQPWDGTFFGNHTLCQNDVYEYVIKVHDKLGKQHAFIGHVTLYR